MGAATLGSVFEKYKLNAICNDCGRCKELEDRRCTALVLYLLLDNRAQDYQGYGPDAGKNTPPLGVGLLESRLHCRVLDVAKH